MIRVNVNENAVGVATRSAVLTPSRTSQLTNDSHFPSDASYVHTDNNYTTGEKTKLAGIAAGAEVNSIETVKVNGTALTPEDRAVNVAVPVKVSDLTNDSGYQTAAQVSDAVGAEASARAAADAVLADSVDMIFDILHGSIADRTTSWEMLQRIVRQGKAGEYLTVGDRLICQRNGTDLVWNVLGIDCDTPADPQFTHSVTLGLHGCVQGAAGQYDAREALFYFADGLAAGTYHFTVKARPVVSGDVNKTFQFTLTQSIPEQGQLVLDVAENATLAGSTAKTYASATSSTPIETVTITEGSGGASLGDQYGNVGDYISGRTVNSTYRALNGNNNYKQSAIRQYLNSDAAAGSVWTPQNAWDRAPSWAANTAGFLNGMDADFLAAIGEVTKTTACYEPCDGVNSETTNERFFLLSRSEVYGGNQTTGGEGAAYPYYSQYSDLSAPGTGNDTNRIKYIGAYKQYWWLRSPTDRGDFVFHVRNTGNIDTNGAFNGLAVVPICCVV